MKDYLQLDVWWKGEGKARTLDRELLRAFSSMFHSRGLPDKKIVEDYLRQDIWWSSAGGGRALDRELLHAFSAMFNSRGLPSKKAIEDYLQLDVWWQEFGKVRLLDRELLRAFSSMFIGRGLPSKKAIGTYLQLDIWRQHKDKGGMLDRELLRTFSSMFHGRGLPAKKAMDDYLKRDVWWQGVGEARTLDRELLRAFSSMFHGRGLPSKKDVDEYLSRDVWWQEKDGVRTLDRELLRVFSSMFHGKGLPSKQVVDEYLNRNIWWQGVGEVRTLDRELLRAFSSVFSGRGLPSKKDVDEYLSREVWWQEKDGVRTLDRELLRAFSSMFHSKGLPDKKAVKAYLQLDIWWQEEDGVRALDRKLLRIFSSIFSGKGLPDQEAVEDYLRWDIWWQGEGQARTLDRKLLRTVSSMFSSRGVLDKTVMADYLRRDIWWKTQGGAQVLDRDLLRTVSSMFSGKGPPDSKAVDDYLQWDIWWQSEGKARTLDWKLLRAFSSMFNSRGLPDKYLTDEVLAWLSWDQQLNRQALKLMIKLYSGAYAGHSALGLPDINELRQAEQKLTALLPSGKHEDDNDIFPLIKMVALYLANHGGTRQLCWTDCEAWLREHPDSLSNKSLLRRLLLTLHYHGGRGIKEAVILISGQPAATKRFVLDALGRGEALVAVKYALQAIEPSEWWNYLFFTRELDSMPSWQQWQRIKGYLETLTPVMPNKGYQRQFLTLIWSLAPADWERFVQPEAVRGLTTLLPSIQVMVKLSRSLTTNQLRTLFDTCLTFQAGLPDKKGLPILFQALLLAQLPLFDRELIIPGVLAQAHDQPEGMVVGINPAIGVADSVSLFIQVMATLLAALWDCEYTVDGQTLTLWPHGKTMPITLPTPSLAWHPDGVQIRHWTLVHLHQFCQAMAATHSNPASHPSAAKLETVRKQSVLSQTDLDQLYSDRDQLTSDQVVEILFRMDQRVPQNIVQRWHLLLGDKHQQALNSTPAWMDGGDEAIEALRDVEDILRGLVPNV